MKKIIALLTLLVTMFSQVISAQDFEITKKDEMIIVGLPCRTSNENAMQDIPAHWAKFFSEEVGKKISNKVSNDIFALYCDFESDRFHPYTLVIGYEVDTVEELPEGLVAKVVPKSSYAQFTATGEFPQSVIHTWGKIWQSSLPRAYTGDFEVYGEDFNGPDKKVDIFISLQKKILK